MVELGPQYFQRQMELRQAGNTNVGIVSRDGERVLGRVVVGDRVQMVIRPKTIAVSRTTIKHDLEPAYKYLAYMEHVSTSIRGGVIPSAMPFIAPCKTEVFTPSNNDASIIREDMLLIVKRFDFSVDKEKSCEYSNCATETGSRLFLGLNRPKPVATGDALLSNVDVPVLEKVIEDPVVPLVDVQTMIDTLSKTKKKDRKKCGKRKEVQPQDNTIWFEFNPFTTFSAKYLVTLNQEGNSVSGTFTQKNRIFHFRYKYRTVKYHVSSDVWVRKLGAIVKSPFLLCFDLVSLANMDDLFMNVVPPNFQHFVDTGRFYVSKDKYASMPVKYSLSTILGRKLLLYDKQSSHYVNYNGSSVNKILSTQQKYVQLSVAAVKQTIGGFYSLAPLSIKGKAAGNMGLSDCGHYIIRKNFITGYHLVSEKAPQKRGYARIGDRYLGYMLTKSQFIFSAELYYDFNERVYYRQYSGEGVPLDFHLVTGRIKLCPQTLNESLTTPFQKFTIQDYIKTFREMTPAQQLNLTYSKVFSGVHDRDTTDYLIPGDEYGFNEDFEI